MTQLDDLIGLFAAVDEILVRPENATREAVGSVLPAYREGAALGWYAEFESWLNRRDGSPGRRRVPLVESGFPAFSDEEPKGTLATRRLLALAALTRADPTTYGPSGTDATVIQAALAPLVPPEPPDGRSRQGTTEQGTAEPAIAGLDATVAERTNRVVQLHQVLADDATDGVFPSIEAWGDFIGVAKAEGLVSADLIPVPPCAATALIDPGEGREPIMSLATSFDAERCTIDEVKAFLEPVNWPGCTDLWIAMDQFEAPDENRYLEVIGSEDQTWGWRLTTALDFARRTRPGEVAVDYRLSGDQAGNGGDGWVDVDEGSIAVLQVGDDVRVTTVKRLRFRGLPLGERFAVLLCALGWASAGQDMVFRCAKGGKEPCKPKPDPSKPGRDDEARRRTVERNIAAVTDLAGVTGAALVACAEAYGRSLRVAQTGTYGVEDLVSDLTDSFVRAADDVARVATVGIRASFGSAGAGPGTVTAPGTGPGTGGPVLAGGSIAAVVTSPLYDDPRTGPNELLVLRGPLERGADDPIWADIVPGPPSSPPTFLLRCVPPPSACGMYWGEVEVFVGGAPAHPPRVIPVSLLVP